MRAARSLACASVLAATLTSAAALAQQNLPGSVEPGQIERRFQPQPPPRSTLQPILPAIPQERLAPAEAERIHLTLSSMQITGASVYRDTDFLPVYQPYLGKDLTVADLYRIADAITAKYRNDGYVLSRAYIPPQTIQGGIARIVIIEGYVDKIRFEGDPLDS